MAETTCLHVQDRESGPIRVVEIPWVSVRIGGAAHCEVRLAERDLAEEVCRLYRRSGAWHLLPVVTGCAILLDGQPVTALCPLPFDVPFRVGDSCLTLRRDRAALPDWGMYSGPAPAPLAETVSALEAPRRALPVAAADGPQRWEMRWKAIGAELKARRARARIDPESKAALGHALVGTEPRVEPRAPAAAMPPERPTLRPPPGAPLAAALFEPDWRGKAAAPACALAKPLPDWKVPKLDRDWTAAGPPEARAAAKVAWKEGIAPAPAAQPSSCRRRELDRQELRTKPSANNFSTESGPLPLASAGQTPQAAETGAAAAGAIMPEAARPAPAHVLGGDPPPAASTEHRAAALEDVPRTPGAALLERPTGAGDEPARGAGAQEQSTPSIVIEPTQRDRAAPARAARARRDVARQRRAETPATPAGVDARPRTRELAQTSSAPEPDRRRAEREHEPKTTPRRHPKPVALDSNRREAIAGSDRMVWPSATDILAMHRAIPTPRAPASNEPISRGAAARSAALPTLAREPGHWSLPVWLAGPPVALLVLAASFAGFVLSCWWAGDSYNASVMSDRLSSADRSALRRPLPESVGPPKGNWMSSTAGHLAHWAIFLTRYDGGERARPEEVVTLLERALEASPINREARLAFAQLEPPPPAPAISLKSLGLSRDSVSLAWTARRLLAAGQKQAALRLYGRALRLANPAARSATGVPRFSDDPGVPRYLLPGEDRVREIVREVVKSNHWPFSEWSGQVPRTAVTSLAAGRFLREQGLAEAATLLDVVLQDPEGRAADGKADALTLAARAEACALRSRWREAGELYRRAIEAIDDDTIKRSWWFNLADIAFRLDDERQRAAALRAAVAVASSDDITRRATDIQRAMSARSVSRSINVRAN
jgi:tetratricopeptide (TPR) repeat protein